MQKFTSYTDFLGKLRQFTSEDFESSNWVQEIEKGKYFRFYKEAWPGMYVLDFTTQLYLYVNEKMANFADHSIADIMKGGLKLALKLWHPDDLKVYDKYILPVNLDYLKKISQSEYREYIFTCNYRVRQRSGKYINIEQKSFFNDFSKDGTPLLTIGFLRDITNRVSDNQIVHTIERSSPQGNQLIFKEVYQPDKPFLTKREREILQLIVEGKQSKAIAELLQISKDNVDKHRKNILQKTSSNNMAQVTAHAFRAGLIE